MADLLGADFGLAAAHKRYACHDLLLTRKERCSFTWSRAGVICSTPAAVYPTAYVGVLPQAT